MMTTIKYPILLPEHSPQYIQLIITVVESVHLGRFNAGDRTGLEKSPIFQVEPLHNLSLDIITPVELELPVVLNAGEIQQ